MSCRSLRAVALVAAGFLAVGCQEGAITASTEADVGLQAAIAEAEVTATLSGETDRAEALRHGADALRWGIRPSRIEVKIQNETYSYLAFEVGVVRRRDDGERVLLRTLVAWTGRPPTALLHVASKSDQALFGHPGNGNGNGNGWEGARGSWKNLADHELWVATAGSADMELAGTGGACPKQPANPETECVTATFDIRINGSFQLMGLTGPDGSPIEIHSDADGVHGVVIQPKA